MCFIVCMMCTIQTSPHTGTGKQKNITFSKKLTREEAADFEEPDAFYEDEDGIKYQLTEWELEEKAGEETRVPMAKNRYAILAWNMGKRSRKRSMPKHLFRSQIYQKQR